MFKLKQMDRQTAVDRQTEVLLIRGGFKSNIEVFDLKFVAKSFTRTYIVRGLRTTIRYLGLLVLLQLFLILYLEQETISFFSCCMDI